MLKLEYPALAFGVVAKDEDRPINNPARPAIPRHAARELQKVVGWLFQAQRGRQGQNLRSSPGKPSEYVTLGAKT